MIICIVDTSVFVELLDVPGKSQRHAETLRVFEQRLTKAKETFLLPVATIVETGNHIAQVADGTHRRACAQRFVKLVGSALDGTSPFTPTPPPTIDEIRGWLAQFVDGATSGMGIADRSLVDLWEKQRALHRNSRVYIWSLDQHLQGYDAASG